MLYIRQGAAAVLKAAVLKLFASSAAAGALQNRRRLFEPEELLDGYAVMTSSVGAAAVGAAVVGAAVVGAAVVGSAVVGAAVVDAAVVDAAVPGQIGTVVLAAEPGAAVASIHSVSAWT